MASRAQIMAAKRNIKKAQRVWDRMHKSVAEGYPPKRLASGGGVFRFKGMFTRKGIAEKRAEGLRRRGLKVRVKKLAVGGRVRYLVYVGGRRKHRV